jgi:signal transduction histidine kinase
MSDLRPFLFSFQTKLVLALTAVIVLAIFLAGAVFVVETREERRQQALDRVAAASPRIYQRALVALLPAQQRTESFNDAIDEIAREQDVRILLVSSDSMVIHDTADDLVGAGIEFPSATPADIRRGFIAWEPAGEFPQAGLTLVSASQRFMATSPELSFSIVLAVETDTLAAAWRDVLPSLLLAAMVALIPAMLVAFALARQVAHPVRRLTAASEAMAGGDFDQRVEVERDDEVGRLAQSFSAMAQRVGQRDTQMRALLANVSHDLKTPMTSITGYAQALADGTAEDGDAVRIGGVIRDEAAHVNQMLADLLYLGEIDAGQVLTQRGDMPLADLVERSLRHVTPAIEAKGIDVTLDLAPDTVLHDVDGDKLERALTNVLENAAKFTPQDGRIAVHGWREDRAAPPEVRCAVSNSGSSIAESDLPRVFDRFFRGDRARRTASGNGLGLAIARELVELNGGVIEARNETPDGVTFTVSLPSSA